VATIESYLRLFCKRDLCYINFLKNRKCDSFVSHDYMDYEVSTISSLHKNIGLFCKRALEKRPYSAKETNVCEESQI